MMIKVAATAVLQHAAAAAKLLQSCPTLCDPIDGSPPGSTVPGILQTRTLEWVAISFSNAWKWKVKVKSLSRVRLFTTPWTAAHQAPPPMGFSRQEYWSGVPLPSPERGIGVQNVTPKYAMFTYWLFWIKGTWETAGTRIIWTSFVSLKAGEKFLKGKISSLYQKGRRHPYHQRQVI